MTDTRDEHSAPLPAPSPSRAKPFAFGVLLLLSGAVIGSGLTAMALRANVVRAQEDPRWLTHRAATRLGRDLDLTDRQAQEVQTIFEAHRERIHTLRTEQHESARELFEDLQNDIEVVLSPEQAERWRERIQRQRERVLRDGPGREERGGPGMGGRRHDGPPPDGFRRGDPPPPPDGFRRDRPPPGDGFRRDGPPPDQFSGDRPPPPPEDRLQ